MLTWTEGQYEDGSRWIKAVANGRYAYNAELMPNERWVLFRKWTSQLTDDGSSVGVCEDVEAIKAEAEADLKRWRDLLDELTAPF